MTPAFGCDLLIGAYTTVSLPLYSGRRHADSTDGGQKSARTMWKLFHDLHITVAFGPRDISRTEREFFDVLDFQLRVMDTGHPTLKSSFMSAFFGQKPCTANAPSSPSSYQQSKGEGKGWEEDTPSTWSDSGEENEAITDFSGSPYGSEFPQNPIDRSGFIPYPPALDPMPLYAQTAGAYALHVALRKVAATERQSI